MHHRQVDRNGDPRHAGEDCCRLQSGHQPNFFSRSWIVVPPQTVPGWSPVALQIAAVIRLAEPMIALAWVEYVALRNVSVGVFGNTSLDDELVVCRPENVPKRESAMTSGHLWAAQ